MPRKASDGRLYPSDRGYDQAWAKLRARKLRANPICQKNGCGEKATVVDHIKPFSGKSDPRRLDYKNLQSLCAHHHNSWKQRIDIKRKGRPNSVKRKRAAVNVKGYVKKR